MRDVEFDKSAGYNKGDMDLTVDNTLEVVNTLELVDKQLKEVDFELDVYTGDIFHTEKLMMDTNKEQDPESKQEERDEEVNEQLQNLPV